MKPYVIFNPTAGSAVERGTLVAKFGRLDPAKVCLTKKSGDGKRFAREAIQDGCRYIVSAGGDGTLNEVINGIGERARHVRVGVLPLGTGNDFARMLRLPASIDENIDILLAGDTKDVDLVRVKAARTHYFVNVSAGGFSGLVDEKLTPAIKRTWGPLSQRGRRIATTPCVQNAGRNR